MYTLSSLLFGGKALNSLTKGFVTIGSSFFFLNMAMLAAQAITTPIKWRYQSGVCYFVQELAVLRNKTEKKYGHH
jgi:hypothetical protein